MAFLFRRRAQEYLDDPDNLGLYDVNTIANYDPEIIAFLDEPIGSALERAPEGKGFQRIEMPNTE